MSYSRYSKTLLVIPLTTLLLPLTSTFSTSISDGWWNFLKNTYTSFDPVTWLHSNVQQQCFLNLHIDSWHFQFSKPNWQTLFRPFTSLYARPSRVLKKTPIRQNLRKSSNSSQGRLGEKVGLIVGWRKSFPVRTILWVPWLSQP